MTDKRIAIIGGSELYAISGLEEAHWQSVSTPWGAPSDDILTGRLNGISIAFLPRHGRGHVYYPNDVPYRANIDALKRLGATQVISISACGSFRDAMAPGILYLWISLLIAPLRAKNHFLALAASRMSQLHSPPAHACPQPVSARLPMPVHGASGRHLSGDGRPTVFHPRRKQGLP
jgi:hypothetical protein